MIERFHIDPSTKSESGVYHLNELIEFYVNEKNDFKSEIINNYPVEKLEVILEHKIKRNAPKDQKDIINIQNYLNKKIKEREYINMKKDFNNFTIEYTDDDITYIDDLIKQFLLAQKPIMNFFGIEKLDRKVEIKLWDNIHDYEKYIKSEMKRLFQISVDIIDWEIGRAIINKKESQIHMLSYKERIKRKGHKLDTIDMMTTLIKHEFVHTCHEQYKQYQEILVWMNEALATTLIDQYGNQKLVLDCSLEELLNGEVNYICYYTLGKYLFEHYDHEYILELAQNNELLKSVTPTLLEEAKEWLKEEKK
ncbi:MAG: hypothetical protein KH135_06170 [Firmicutes bacterium]|nr:hypothetical protein [Bacillota bacterium]